MVLVNIDIIHGDMLVKNMSTTIAPEELHGVSIGEILARTPKASQVSIKAMMGQAVVVVHEEGAQSLFDARTGAALSPIAAPRAMIRPLTVILRAMASLRSTAGSLPILEMPSPTACQP